MEPAIVTRHLQGSSELTLHGRIKKGLIDSLESRTYESRLRAMLQTLHTLRQSSREFSMVRTFSDSTDRIRTITDLRMSILEDEQKLLLAVTFDRPWEPYLRIIWREVGTQLDTIFCNCEDYPISYTSDFETYGKWIREARTDTRFFYNPAALTFDDGQYLRRTERLFDAKAAVDLEAALMTVQDPALIAIDAARKNPGYTVRQGMQALSVIYRLADLYPPRTADGDILLRAAKELLRELLPVLALMPQDVKDAVERRFKAQLAWFRGGDTQTLPPPPVVHEPADTKDVQGGILTPYPKVTHGCVLLYSFDEPAGSANFLESVQKTLCLDGDAGTEEAEANRIHANIAFTPQGLRALGLNKEEMDRFPNDFLEGMQERAGLLGDVRGNHPRNWNLPPLYSPPGYPPQLKDAQVDLSTVHAVVTLTRQSTDPGHGLEPTLQKLIERWSSEHPSARLLSIQPTRRWPEGKDDRPREHFGFIDGLSQPKIGTPSTTDKAWTNTVGKGELLLGYMNDRGDPPADNEWTSNGSFLVVRKLRQDVDAFNAAVATSPLPREDTMARMMGRTLDGDPIAKPGNTDNEFHYDGDPTGKACPFAAHIRRANPRTEQKEDAHKKFRPTVPRIMRRGMSYGSRHSAGTANEERGLMFMAYNASISEQFEVIQRWITGGNSTNVLSEHRDPFLGVPQVGESRHFRMHDGTNVQRVKLHDEAARQPVPFVKLEWGLYAFAPSATALAKLIVRARPFKPPFHARPVNMPAKNPDKVAKLIDDLLAAEKANPNPGDEEKQEMIEGWKSILEDLHARAYGDSEAVWAELRRRGGVLRTRYGVLVTSKAGVLEVLKNRANYSVCGYVERLEASSGMMYLGMDQDATYEKQSVPVNTAIFDVSEEEAFACARERAIEWLAELRRKTVELAVKYGEKSWDLTFDLKEVSDYTLGMLCEDWFGLQDGVHFRRGGSPWDWDPANDLPYYPGHFTAPSRYVFQPCPLGSAVTVGELRGKAILAAMVKFVEAHRKHTPPTVPTGKIVEKIFAAFPTDAENELLAKTILGTLIGFLPTVEGNFKATMNEWIDEHIFWDLQNKYRPQAGNLPHAEAFARAKKLLESPLMRTMQFRPAPEVSWRTAKADHKLCGVKIRKGDKVSISLVSATQEDLANGVQDVSTVFGGYRKSGAAQPPKLPTHACPGYKIGMGVLLGMITALIEFGPVRATPAPLTMGLSGKV